MVTRLVTVQAIANVLQNLYLFGFHKISLIAIFHPFGSPVHLGDPVSPTSSRFRELAISVTRAHGYIDYIMRIVHKRCAREQAYNYNLKPMQVGSWHIFLFFY